MLEAVRPGARAHLIGLSNADLVLNAFARTWPARADSLTWISPSGIDARTMTPTMRALGQIPMAPRLLGQRLRQRCIQRIRSHQAHLPADAPPEAAAAYETALHTVETGQHFSGAVASHLAALPRPDQVIADARVVEAAAIPVMMLTFGEEADATEAGVSAMTSAVSGVVEVAMERGTHMGLLERPGEIIPHVLRFLESHKCT